MEKEEKIIELPLKYQKPKHSLYGGSIGYKCPVCRGTGMDKPLEPRALYGGNGCRFCECSGRVRNRDCWIFIRAQQIVKRYKKKLGGKAQYFKIK